MEGVCEKQIKNLSKENKKKLITQINKIYTQKEIAIGKKRLVIGRDNNKNPILQEIQSCPFLLLSNEQLLAMGVPEKYIEYVKEATDLSDLDNINIPPDARRRLEEYFVMHEIHKDYLSKTTFEAEDIEHLYKFLREDVTSLLLYLTDEQREIAYKRTQESPIIVQGTVGSGKTTVAIYRLRYFAKKGEKVLYLTYNRTLVRAAKVLLYQLEGYRLPNAEIRTLHEWCKKFLLDRGRKTYLLSNKKTKEILKDAINKIKDQGKQNVISDKPLDFWEKEIIGVIKGIAEKNKTYYMSFERRGIEPLNIEQRKLVWKIYLEYERLKDYLWDWGDILVEVLRYIKQGKIDENEKYDHVIIDEVQDINKVGLKIAINLAKKPSGIFLVGDATQSIYNTGFRWKDVGIFISSKNVYKLEKSFRNTQQILLVAKEILKDYIDKDFILPSIPNKIGEKPKIIRFKNNFEQIRWVANDIAKKIKNGNFPPKNIAVLSRIKKYLGPLQKELQKHDIESSHYKDNMDLNADTVKLLTFHSAKGLEFPVVYIIYVNGDLVPLAEKVQDEITELQERKLLYVAITRAMQELIITCSDRNPSPFIDNLDRNFVDIVYVT